MDEEKISMTSAGGVEITYSIAGLGGRSFAFVVDWHIRFFVALGWFFLVTIAIGRSMDMDAVAEAIDNNSILFIYLGIVPPLIIYFFYHPILEILMKGRTPGKRMAGVRIVSKEGHTASDGALLVRNIFRIIDSLPAYYMLGIIVAMFNKQNLRIGDMAAGTVLVYEERTNKKGIDKLVTAQRASGLSTEMQELITELLERWKQLDRSTRINMAKHLLQQLGQEVPAEKKPSKLDAKLQASLKRVSV